MKIGFIGLGRMGAAMASNLARAGHDVAVFNRTRERAQPLADLGAVVCESAAQACRDRDAVITMLADDAAVEATTFGPHGALVGLPQGSIHISSSTISTALSRRLAQTHAEAAQKFVAAPVFGRPDAAAAGKLFVVAAGEPNAVKSCAPIFEAIGQRTFIVGEQAEAANLVKLSGNFLIATVIEALGEAVALARKGGVDAHAYLDLLTSTLFSAPVYKTYGALIVDEKYEPAGFAASLGAKDVRLALSAAESLKVPLPLASLLRDRFLTLSARGDDALDWSAIARLAAEDAGLPPGRQG